MTRVDIRIPTPLRTLAGGSAVVAVDGATVGDALDALVRDHPALRKQLYTPEGRLRSFVSVYRNEDDVRSLDREKTELHEGDVVSIVPAIAGGAEDSVGLRAPRGAGTAGGIISMGEAPPLTPTQLRRYSRHLLLPEVGVRGQRRLGRSKVLLIGAGGLGAPAALYLAAAGVGELGLVDFDRVEFSNLQRQVLYGTSDVGKPKLDSAARRLGDLNPDVRVHPIEGPLTSENALEVLRPYDVVVDGTDNFPTRYLVNDACVLLGKPNVYGSIYRFEGQASVFDARKGPCYRCLYPEPPPPGMVPSCAEGGVLGVLPGIVGTLQAAETVKLLLGLGDTLVGRLLLFDALEMRFRELKLHRDPACVISGDHPSQRELVDYPAFCGVTAVGAGPLQAVVPELSPEELQTLLATPAPPLLLDVREPGEFDIVHIPGATLIPQGQLPDRVTELTSAKDVVVYCKTGARSSRAVRLLLDLGFTNVRNLTGGVDAWVDRIDPSLPRY